MIDLDVEEMEEDAEILYPMPHHTQIGFKKIVNNSELEKKVAEIQINKFKKVIEKNRKVFSSDPGRTHLVEMDIELLDEAPMRAKPYGMSHKQIEILREDIKNLLDLGVIEIGHSDFTFKFDFRRGFRERIHFLV